MAEIKSKSAVSNGYIEDCLEKYGDLPNLATEKSNVVILGAREGNIGGEIANVLKKEDYASVACVDLDTCDLTQYEHPLMKLYEKTDILIMCQGYTSIDWIENQTYDTMSVQLGNSLFSHIWHTNQFVKASMDKPYRKTIIYIGSMAYRNVLNGSSVYCAAKAGLNMFARCMAWELAPKGYDVYILHPGNVKDTPMAKSTMEQLAAYRGMTHLEAQLYWNTGNPRKTILSAHDIAVLVSEICDNKMMYAAGNPIDLTGGQR